MAIDNYIPKVGDQNRIDNTSGKTMRGAIAGLMRNSSMIRIASGYFRLSGVVELEDDFRDFFAKSKDNKIQLLISNKYDRQNTDTRKILEIAEKSSNYTDEAFLLDNKFYQELVNWIQTGRIEVKIFVDSKFYATHSKDDIAFLHGKAYLFSNDFYDRRGDVLIGSSNFTYGGLVKNRELNIFSQDSFPPIREWFDEMWEKYSEVYSHELLVQLEEQKEQSSIPKVRYTPIEYFYWSLGKYFGKKPIKSLEGRIKEIERLLPYPQHADGNRFFAHQFRGIKHVYEQLNKFDTQVLADGVGLGKTLEAATVIKLYLQDLRVANDKRKILVLANERLREQWSSELENVAVSVKDVDMTTRQKFTGLDDETLKQYAEKYALVVIDEAHEGFLRKNNTVYKKMKQMIHFARQTQGRTLRGLLLTATPWNNSREDVIRLGLLFLNIDKVPKEKQYYKYVLTEREKILYDVNDSGNYNQNAYIEFWKDIFYQRTRRSLANERFLSDQYPIRKFPLESGEQPFVMRYSPAVSAALSEILEKIIALKLPYQDTVWQYFGPLATSNVIMRQRFQLLRRADSSNAAFGKSLENIKMRLEVFQHDIQQLVGESLPIVKKYFYKKVHEEYAEEYAQEVEGFDFIGVFGEIGIELNKSQEERIKYINENLSEQTVDAYLNEMVTDAINDIRDLEEILEQWKVVSKNDEKQKVVITQIKDIVRQGGKVLVFSEFSDTVEDYYRTMLQDSVICETGIGMIRGGVSRMNYDDCPKKDVLGRFSPQSKMYDVSEDNQIGVLIGTDAIATGQNLQDANHLITIELPYNPMRLEQRIGRIDRPKLNGENQIYIYAFPSEEIINAELKLSERFEGKAQGARSDTEGDFKLPFVNNGKYQGIVSNVSQIEEEKAFLDQELIASVSEEESRERVYEFYQKHGENFEISNECIAFPYSFVNAEIDILLYQIELKDVNNHSILRVAPALWDLKKAKMLSFTEAENLVRNMLNKEVHIEERVARCLVDENGKKYDLIIENAVEKYNADLKSVVKLETQPQYVYSLRQNLQIDKRKYREYFKQQGIEPKRFQKIIDSLGGRGFNEEQSSFLKTLRDSEGNVSNKNVYENIWSNLKRFVELFDIMEIDVTAVRYFDKAHEELSVLNPIAAVIGIDKTDNLKGYGIDGEN